MTDFLTVGQQVLILFLLIGVGFICGKKGIINETASKVMADVVLYFATPCVIIHSFQQEMTDERIKGLLVALASAIAIHVLAILIADVVFRNDADKRRRVLRFAVVFSNAGYMALPLQKAVLGAEGVFYGAVYVAIFNLTMWSWGLLTMSGDKKSLSVKKLILNPGVIGLTVGVIIFLLQWQLPEVLAQPITHLGNLNTPVPMLLIGYFLSKTNVKQAFRDGRSFGCMAIRLLFMPLLALGGMYLCGIRGDVLVSMVIAASAPVAAATTMFATKFNADTSLSVNMVSLTTLCSVITMPLIVALAKILSI
ncbi:MAG: AEC family transporter [Clostridia bacterium]|nr:AEC family transporter [Clostridia bacterium]